MKFNKSLHRILWAFLLLWGLSSKLPLNAATISGLVQDLDGNGIQSVAVLISGASNFAVVTDLTGAYTVPGLVVGNNYVLTPSLGVTVFQPSTRAYIPLSGDQAAQNFVIGKVWSGGGSDSLASNPNNWTAGVVPSSGDVVRFDATGANKTCVWDSTAPMAAIQLKVGFSSSVVFQNDVVVGQVRIEAGELKMGSGEVHISSHFVQTGGRFEQSLNGVAFWEGGALQNITMIKTSVGGNKYDSFFFNFRVNTSSTVRINSDLVIDGSFNISTGRFEAGSSTITLTGGLQVGSLSGSAFNWDDSSGQFSQSAGGLVFYSTGHSYRFNQGVGNSYTMLRFFGNASYDALSSINVNNDVFVGQSGESPQVNFGDGFNHRITGSLWIGPTSLSSQSNFTLGASSLTVKSLIQVGTASFVINGGQLNIQGSTFTVNSLGKLTLQGSGTNTLVFNNNSIFNLSQGTLTVTGSAIFTSSAPGVARYKTQLGGTVDISRSSIFESMDINGLNFGLGANPIQLISPDFRKGLTGGAAIRFYPVSFSSLTINSPTFDSSISTNVHATINTNLIPTSSINIINPLGVHGDVSYEYDPSGIVHWGVIGTPSGFSGTALGVSSITWSWQIVNNPLYFVVSAATGGPVSENLTALTTFWTETNLSTNTLTRRFIRAYTDTSQADSSVVNLYTLAWVPSNFVFSQVNISSLTLTWGANSNPASTVYTLERSSGASYVLIASGTRTSILPYQDTGLVAETSYSYRVKAFNGDGVETIPSLVVSTQTNAVPPPAVYSISPSTAQNLGTFNFSVTGNFIQAGATLRFKKAGFTSIVPTSLSILSDTSITGSVKLTGAVPQTWDVEIQNPDGKFSVGTGNDLLNITAAISTPPITIQNYYSTSSLTLNSLDGRSRLTMANGVMNDSRIYISTDPSETPLRIDPTLITTANAKLNSSILVPGSLRELVAFDNAGVFTGSFTGAVTFSISYLDQNRDGIVDNVTLRTSSLKMAVLNEATSSWDVIANSRLDASNSRVIADLPHFSVYALVGSPASSDLSQVKIIPSPWKPGSGGNFDSTQISFSNLTESGTISIYSLSGKIIRELSFNSSSAGILLWDGLTNSGDKVPSGVYLVVIKSDDGQKKTLKMGIER